MEIEPVKKYFLVSEEYEQDHFEMWSAFGYTRDYSFDNADVVVFGGSYDVDPSLYNRKPHKETYSNLALDTYEREIWRQAFHSGKAIVGICRGHQFNHVMNGGILEQHIYDYSSTGRHDHAHEIHLEHFQDRQKFGEIVRVTSSHHQAIDGVSVNDKNILAKAKDGIVEAMWYPQTRSLGVQFHPEWAQLNSTEQQLFFHWVNIKLKV
jgi:putative glutamine amidotransferase